MVIVDGSGRAEVLVDVGEVDVLEEVPVVEEFTGVAGPDLTPSYKSYLRFLYRGVVGKL